MKKQLLILSGLLLCVIIMGCKKTHCPAFPKAIADTYFPYTENSMLNYANINGDTLIFTIDYYWLSDSYSFSADCDCEAHSSFYAESGSDPFSLDMNGNILLQNNRVGIKMLYTWGSFTGNFVSFYIEGINPYASNNVRLFGDTITLTTSEPNDRITSVQVIAEKGVTRFFDTKQDCEWVLVEGK